MGVHGALFFLAAQALVGQTAAQVPSIWKPMDVITYFCARWYHQGKSSGALGVLEVLTHAAVVKNDVLYLYGGIETFNVPNLTVKSENNTLGYSK